MKKTLFLLVLGAFCIAFCASCKTGEGCPAENNWQKQIELKDKKSKPKSGLFGKEKGK
jgi:hypothetical protein